MEHIVTFLSGLDIGYIYLMVLLIAAAENIFPPLPSDMVIVFSGSLIAIGKGSGVVTVLCATAGSTLGFMIMYVIGEQIGHKVLETGRIRFISVALVRKVEAWFRHYGYWVVVANRFLAGTRAVISFCAGMSDMRLAPTTLLSAASALLWNTILVYTGILLGDNWRRIGTLLATYSKATTAVITVALLAWAVIAVLRARRKRANAARNGER